MTSGVLLLLSVAISRPAADEAGRPADDTVRPAAANEVLLYDRLHQTMLSLNDTVIPAYLDHFRDEPENLEVVKYYADRLAAVRRGKVAEPSKHVRESETGSDWPPDRWTRGLMTLALEDSAENLEEHLKSIGSKPHALLQRSGEEGVNATTARCPLFDPALLWAHRRLWELKTGIRTPAEPENLRDAIVVRHAAIVAARAQSKNSELSLRRFLDLERQTVWELAWLYRCLGVEQDRAGDATGARQSYLRAWAIGDALFPAAERGRLERFAPVFLAELGDIYARLGRYDLMLRYMYSEKGLPAQFEMARPVAELARVAESVRLARPGEKPSEEIEETFPETVSQILFEQAVPATPSGRAVAATGSPDHTLAYAFIGVGGLLLVLAVAAIGRRATRRDAKYVGL